MKCPLPGGFKKKKKKATRVGDVRFKASYFLLFRFAFPSPGAFNLPEKVGGGGGGEEKGKKFAKNKVCAGERRESVVEGTTGSLGVRAGPWTQKILPGAGAGTHTLTHTHTPTPLCSRLEFLQSGSLALLLAALHASAGPLVKELCPSGSPSRGVGDARSLAACRSADAPQLLRRRRARSLVPPPRPAPQVSGCASPPPLLLPRLAGAEKLPTCVASPPLPLPRLQLSLAARWGGGGRREGGGD